MPYKNMDDAIALSKLGKGSLVSSMVTPDNEEAKDYVIGAASLHGRILVLNKDCAKESTGHGSPMPLLTRGGQEELEEVKKWVVKRGFTLPSKNRIQGHPTTLSKITEQFQYGADMPEANPHVFRKCLKNLRLEKRFIPISIL